MREQGAIAASNAVEQYAPEWTDEQTSKVYTLKVKLAREMVDAKGVTNWSTARDSVLSDGDMEKGTGVDDAAVSMNRVLMVHNIGHEFHEAELTDVFSEVGIVDSVTVRSRTDDTGEFTGVAGTDTSYALVKMATTDDANAVIKAGESGLFDRRLSYDQKEPLRVQRFNRLKAAQSTGAMAGALQSGHSTLASMWEKQQLATQHGLQESFVLKPKCWDELTRVQTSQAYWWFVFIMFLKLLVNFIFIAGDSLSFNWGMWLQIVLITAALISFWIKPYIVANDNALEQVIFLSLATVLSIINSGLEPDTDLTTQADGVSTSASSSGWDPWDVVVVVVCCVVASVIGLYPTVAKLYERYTQMRRKQTADKSHIASTLEKAVPAFQSLPLATRDEIAQQDVEVEVFDVYEVVMREGEAADAFYIIEKGDALVTVHGRPVAHMTSGQFFGEAALVNARSNGKRTATVTALTQLVCFRITRASFVERFASEGHGTFGSDFSENLKAYEEHDAAVMELEKVDDDCRRLAKGAGGFASLSPQQQQAAQEAAAAAAAASGGQPADLEGRPLPASPSAVLAKETSTDTAGSESRSAAVDKPEWEEADILVLQQQLDRIRYDPNAEVSLPQSPDMPALGPPQPQQGQGRP
jgi:hypothetical protein